MRDGVAALKQAVADLDAGEDDSALLMEPVNQLETELDKPKPRRTWKTIAGFAPFVGTWQGWDRVQHMASTVAPQLEQLVRAVPR